MTIAHVYAVVNYSITSGASPELSSPALYIYYTTHTLTYTLLYNTGKYDYISP